MRYPYIPRKYYPAVMFAAKMVREGTGRNVAVRRAADYYAVEDQFGTDATGLTDIRHAVVRGKSADTVTRRFAQKDLEFNRRHDYGGGYAPNHWHSVIAEFATKDEAEKYMTAIECKED